MTLLASTPEPEKTVVLAARLCYSPSAIAELEEEVKGLSLEKFLGRILRMGHLSVLEHASFTFGVDGISRVTSHQLVRHRLASYSQQSQRYVKFSDPEYVVPRRQSHRHLPDRDRGPDIQVHGQGRRSPPIGR